MDFADIHVGLVGVDWGAQSEKEPIRNLPLLLNLIFFEQWKN